MALHSVLTHLDNKNAYARMLFVDFSSAFNTVIPTKLMTKLGDLGINTSMCNWILDFLTDRPQNVRSGLTCSTSITLNTGEPQGCVLSPFLYSIFTSDCKPVYGSNSIVKFADDTTVIGLISNNDETAYREEIQHLATWCTENNLLLNTTKTKELIVDFRKKSGGTHDTFHINGMAVERVSSYKFLGTHISADMSWTTNTSSLVRKAHQRLFFLRTLRKNQLSSAIMELLLLRNRKHPDQLCRSVVWELLCCGAQGTAAGGENCPAHYRDSTTCHRAHPEETLSAWSSQHPQGLLSPSLHTVFSTALRQAFQEPPDQDQQTKEQVFPRAVSLLNWNPR